MKKLFYSGLAGLAVFEVLKVYFIMPMPGSQRIDSLEVAYALHTNRWLFRVGFGLAIVAGARGAFQVRRKWLPAIPTLLAAAIVWFFNFQMTAESIFQEPRNLAFKARSDSQVDESSVVLGVERNGEAKAYPIRFLVYHHQVQDTVGGQRVLVTYCSVCRTGRVFEPLVDGQPETFRLVGMDHFNAMFEDRTTGSWWRQANGEAVMGRLKGALLPEVASRQLTASKWFELHPNGVVMQPDEASRENYDPEGKYERGKSRGDLTRTDPASWQDKSWVVGVQLGTATRAYDWNRLKEQRIINDRIAATPVVLVLATDQKSFAVFERPAESGDFTIKDNVLTGGGRSYDLFGRDLTDPTRELKRVQAHQEFWHSWRTFHPGTERYP